MLATPTATVPHGAGWWFEAKWDGIRSIAVLSAGHLELWSRNRLPLTGRFPELAAVPAALVGAEAVLDGEIVAFGPDGRPDFGLLARQAVSAPGPLGPAVCYLAFDLLFWGDAALLDAPLAHRRERLLALGLGDGAWRSPPHVTDDPAPLLGFVAEHRLEGVVAKRADAPYEPGRRSRAWRKWKRTRSQEFVVGGFLPGRGGRAGELGSLLLGTFDAGGRLRYAGRVGTGFDAAERRRLLAELTPAVRAEPPFVDPPRIPGVRWVEPRVVVEVRFAQRTADGRLRHPSYAGRRLDKDPAEVVWEEPG
jgi:bifunctional non-homologous end joining protein LigD